MMPVEVVPADSARDLRRFIDVPWRVYDPEAHPLWVPPLRMMVRDALDERRNPFYENAERRLFLCMQDGRPAGRIAAIVNRAHNDFHDDRIGFFGFFEAVDDPQVSGALFEAAEGWLRAKGLERMRGPTSPSTNHECGLLVDGFEHHPTFMTPWNPPYYAKLFEASGLLGVRDLLGYRMSIPDGFTLPERVERHAERALRRTNLSFRSLDMRRFDEEIDTCWDVYNSAWEKNWGFVPFSRPEFVRMAKDLKALLHPDFAFVAEVDGRPAGFMLILLDYNLTLKRIGSGRLLPFGLLRLLRAKKRLGSARVLALGIKEEYRSRSLLPLFIRESYRRGVEHGVLEGEASWVLEDNEALNKPLRSMGLQVHRKWRMYEKALADPVEAARDGHAERTEPVE